MKPISGIGHAIVALLNLVIAAMGPSPLRLNVVKLNHRLLAAMYPGAG